MAAKPVALAIAVAVASRFGGGPGWTQSPRIAVVSRRDGVCACRVVMVLSLWQCHHDPNDYPPDYRPRRGDATINARAN